MLSQYQDSSIDDKVLQDYIVSNCCKSGRAQHRDRIADVSLLPALVQRWRAEIVAEIQGRLRSDSVIFDTVNVIASSPLSEFRPHIAEPTADDSVAFKIQNQLEDRDFERGSLYVFNRISSPGHVKIGWTARSVQGRLDDWSRCGYLPNLLLSEVSIPFAQRAETLAHYELIREWRRERMCKADWCRKSHCEWFEVSIERAIGVVGDWAKLFKATPLYDEQGSLKPYWRFVVKDVIKGGETVTGHMLLQRLPQIQQDEHMTLAHAAASAVPIKRELAKLIQAISQTNQTKGRNQVPVGPIPIKQERSFVASSHLDQSLHEPVSPLMKLLITPIKRSKSTPALGRGVVSGDDAPLAVGSLPSVKTETTLAQTVVETKPIIKAEEDE